MYHIRLMSMTALLLAALLIVGCGARATPEAAAPATDASGAAAEETGGVPDNLLLAFAPLPEAPPAPSSYEVTEELVNLGRMLYYEPRLSLSQEISCNTCHQLDKYGVDGLPTAVGHEGHVGPRNSPTVYNAALHVAQFWDGREPDVEAQARGPVLAAGEMGMPDPEHVNKVLQSIPDYEPLFVAAFPDDADPVNFDNMAIAIGAFERGLLTPSRFDQFLTGDATQLTAQEQKGLVTFVEVGCAGCHSGAALGGNSYQKMGLVVPFETADEGRAVVTGNEADAHVFKVPSLRNIAETGPYLHDGSVASLDEMVRLMATHQLGRELNDEQVADIVAFLQTLTGEIDEAYIAQPELPASGPDTPPAESGSSGG